MTSQHSSCGINIIFILFTITLIGKKLHFLGDKLTLGKASSELNEEVQPALSIGFHENQIGDFVYLLI